MQSGHESFRPIWAIYLNGRPVLTGCHAWTGPVEVSLVNVILRCAVVRFVTLIAIPLHIVSRTWVRLKERDSIDGGTKTTS